MKKSIKKALLGLIKYRKIYCFNSRVCLIIGIWRIIFIIKRNKNARIFID